MQLRILQGPHLVTISQQLKDWRTAASLTQPQAAKALGVNLDSLQNWESGRRIPNGETMLKLLDRLNGQKGGRPKKKGKGKL